MVLNNSSFSVIKSVNPFVPALIAGANPWPNTSAEVFKAIPKLENCTDKLPNKFCVAPPNHSCIPSPNASTIFLAPSAVFPNSDI